MRTKSKKTRSGFARRSSRKVTSEFSEIVTRPPRSSRVRSIPVKRVGLRRASAKEANLSSGSLNFFPETGDIVDWNKQYWEINGVTEPQLVAGHPGYKHSIKAMAGRARLSSLQIEERVR